jgi:hypothetical protein
MLLLATASKSCKLNISSMWGLTYSSSLVSPDPFLAFCGIGTVLGAGADVEVWVEAAGWGRLEGMMGPRCLEGSRLSLIASGGWIGWNNVSRPEQTRQMMCKAYFVLFCSVFARIFPTNGQVWTPEDRAQRYHSQDDIRPSRVLV